jgi:hypothetical protein
LLVVGSMQALLQSTCPVEHVHVFATQVAPAICVQSEKVEQSPEALQNLVFVLGSMHVWPVVIPPGHLTLLVGQLQVPGVPPYPPHVDPAAALVQSWKLVQTPPASAPALPFAPQSPLVTFGSMHV